MAIIERAPPGMLRHLGNEGVTATEELPWFLDPNELGRILRRRWLTVVLPVVLLIGAAAGYLSLPAQYSATTQLLIDPRGLAVLKDEVNPQGQANEATLLLVDSQLRVLASDDVLQKVVAAQHLETDPDFVEPGFVDRTKASIHRLLGRKAEPEADPRVTALRALRDRLSARRLERSFAVDVSVTTDNRDKSARLAQAVTETYLSTEAANRSQVIRRAGEALNSRMGELRDGVQQAENAAQAFRNKNNLVGTRTQLVSEQQLGQLSDQLGAARAKAAEQQARLKQIEGASADSAKLDSIQEVLQSQTIGQLRTQLATAERQRADVALSLGERHPAMSASDVQVRSARAQLDAEVKRIATAVRNEYRASLANVAELSQALEKRKADALNVGDSFVKLRELERQVEARRGVYESFLSRTRQLQEQQQLDTSTSRIISPALPAAKRQGPPAPLVLAVALIAGFGLGIGGSLMAEQFSGRVRSRNRLETRTKRQVLGFLPMIRQASKRGGERLGAGPYEVAITRLRNRLRHDLPSQRPHIIVVTSADDSVGRSDLAVDFATAAANEKERVLLVDAAADGAVTREIGLPPRKDPGRAMAGRAPLSEVLVRHRSGLALVPQDSQTARADLRNYVDGLLDAQESFDLIIIHVGLIGADAIAERLAGDPRVSAVLLTVRNGQSRYAQVEKALAAIGDRARVGLVLTEAEDLD